MGRASRNPARSSAQTRTCHTGLVRAIRPVATRRAWAVAVPGRVDLVEGASRPLAAFAVDLVTDHIIGGDIGDRSHAYLVAHQTESADHRVTLAEGPRAGAVSLDS